MTREILGDVIVGMSRRLARTGNVLNSHDINRGDTCEGN